MADPNFAEKTIWTADNLDVLRGMNSACVDLIYLNPPFNSNRTYAAPVGVGGSGRGVKGHVDALGPGRRMDGPLRRRTPRALQGDRSGGPDARPGHCSTICA